MSARDTIREFLYREPFDPFRVVTTSGEAYIVRNPDLVALLRSEVFIAQPNSDRRVYVPWLHIAAVETVNGRPPHGPARRRKRR